MACEPVIMKRQFSPTGADLIDRLAIDQIKETLLGTARAKEYAREMNMIEESIDDLIRKKRITLTSGLIKKIAILSQINLHVWRVKDVMAKNPENYMKILTWAQDLNSMKNCAKNSILKEMGQYSPATRRAAFFSKKGKQRYAFLLRDMEK